MDRSGGGGGGGVEKKLIKLRCVHRGSLNIGVSRNSSSSQEELSYVLV